MFRLQCGQTDFDSLNVSIAPGVLIVVAMLSFIGPFALYQCDLEEIDYILLL